MGDKNFEVLGNTGEVLFSDAIPVVVFWGKVTVSGTAGAMTSFTTNAPNFPVVFVHSSNVGSVISIAGSAGAWTVTLSTGATTAYVFCKIPNVAQSSGIGMVTYAADKSLSFSTNYRLLKICARHVLSKSGSQTIDYGTIPTVYAISCPYIGYQILPYGGCWGLSTKLAIKRESATTVTTYTTAVQDAYQIPYIFVAQSPVAIHKQLVLFINPAEYV